MLKRLSLFANSLPSTLPALALGLIFISAAGGCICVDSFQNEGYFVEGELQDAAAGEPISEATVQATLFAGEVALGTTHPATSSDAGAFDAVIDRGYPLTDGCHLVVVLPLLDALQSLKPPLTIPDRVVLHTTIDGATAESEIAVSPEMVSGDDLHRMIDLGVVPHGG